MPRAAGRGRPPKEAAAPKTPAVSPIGERAPVGIGTRPSPRPASPLDFETITNPLGPPRGVLKALARLDPGAPADPEWRVLREALAAQLGVPDNQVWAGEGLLPRAAKVLLRPGHRALLFTPCPRSNEEAVLAAGGEALEFDSRFEGGWAWNARRAAGPVRGLRVAYGCLGHPNDPTGTYLGPDEVVRLARLLAPAVLVLDERLLPFAEKPWESIPLLEQHPNLAVLRSLSVSYGLGDLTVEYLVAAPSFIRRLAAHAPPPGPKAAAAQAAGLAAIEDPGHVESGRLAAEKGVHALRNGCLGLGLPVVSGSAHYLMVRTEDASQTARNLLAAGFRVLDCTPLGLPRDIRIAPRSPTEGRALVGALGRLRA